MNEQLNGRRKYTLNLEGFEIDSSAKFYWLGFLASDGYVAKTEPRVKIELKDEDEEILIKFLKFC